jgi:hypothetical protein
MDSVSGWLVELLQAVAIARERLLEPPRRRFDANTGLLGPAGDYPTLGVTGIEVAGERDAATGGDPLFKVPAVGTRTGRCARAKGRERRDALGSPSPDVALGIAPAGPDPWTGAARAPAAEPDIVTRHAPSTRRSVCTDQEDVAEEREQGVASHPDLEVLARHRSHCGDDASALVTSICPPQTRSGSHDARDRTHDTGARSPPGD